MTGEKLSFRARALGLGLSLLLAGLQVLAMLAPREDWPFSSAPMFARHVDRRTPVYYIEWWLERGAERRLVAPQADLGIGELPFRRGYFAAYYGSADPRHPGRRVATDSEATFVARQSEYCRRLAAAWTRRRKERAPAFSLVVRSDRDSRPIGACGPEGFRRQP